jgi:hypothetical protein
MAGTALSIDLITPAFNSGGLLMETVQSVNAAWVEGLNYAIWDGAGSDGSSDHCSAQVRGPVKLVKGADSGQYDALIKGFGEMTGEIMGWINAGDILFPWTLKAVQEIFCRFPEVYWIYGRPCAGSDGIVRRVGPLKPVPAELVRLGFANEKGVGYLAQEAMFWRRSLYDQVGGLRSNYELIADFDLWTRFAGVRPPVSLSTPLAMFAHHGDNRSQRLKETALRELQEWEMALPGVDRINKGKLAWKLEKVRVVRRVSQVLSKILFRCFGLGRLEGKILVWNSRGDKDQLESAQLSADHLA